MKTNALLALSALAVSPDALPIAMRRAGGRVMAGPQNAETMFNQINDLLTTRFGEHDTQIDNLTTAMQAIQTQVDAGGVAAGFDHVPIDRDYSTAFASYFRKGTRTSPMSASTPRSAWGRASSTRSRCAFSASRPNAGQRFRAGVQGCALARFGGAELTFLYPASS